MRQLISDKLMSGRPLHGARNLSPKPSRSRPALLSTFGLVSVPNY